MIACKARFMGRIYLFLGIFFLLLPAGAGAHDYIYNPIYEFDRGPRDYTGKYLSDTVRSLLFRSEFTVKQTGYSSNSGNLTNLQFATDFSQMVTSRFSAMAPDEIDRDLYNAERFTVRLYESLARRWDRLNPIPGLYYGIIIRSPAYPFIVLDGLNNYALDLGTFPFTDDQRFRQTMLWQRQYGFEFRIIF
jgi:hypothetical protein